MNNRFTDKNRRVLVIDDNRSIHDDFRKILSPAESTRPATGDAETALFGDSVNTVRPPQFEVDSAYQGQEGLMLVKKALEEGRPYAMAFVDVRMPPGWDGIETTQRIWEIDREVQIVICTAYSDYSWGEVFEKISSYDGMLILKKPFDAVEAFQMAHALTQKWWLHQQSRRKMEELESRVSERTCELQQSNHSLQSEVAAHQRAEEILRESEAKFLQLTDSITDVFWMTSPDMQTTHYVSPAYEKIWGRRVDDLRTEPRQWVEAILPEDRERVWATFSRLAAEESSVSTEYRIARPDGVVRWISSRGFQVRDASGKVIRITGIASDITERKRAENALRESDEKFRQLADNITDVFWIRSPDFLDLHYISPAYEKIWGRSVESLYANPAGWAAFIQPEDRERVQAAYAGLTHQAPSIDVEYRIVRPNGEVRWVRARGFQVRDAADNLIRHTGIITDITERKQLEARLFQSQRLEIVGKLAGGVAHEFNSILTAIIGQSELLLRDLPAGDPLAKNAVEISQAAGRAATLTRQLLAYGRKQILQPEILDLNRVILSMEGTFHHLMGGDVVTHIVAAPGLHAVMADAGQIEQVIMNMAMNAHDAMPNGGKFTLETADVSFDQESVGRYPDLQAGDYVMLAMTDTGGGMSEDVRVRAFEPFFSTKGVGEGTGLGLATCYGIVKQSGGHISVYSEPGRGATFKIYLPRVDRQAEVPVRRIEATELPRGTETILLVEDDPALREMAATLLRRLGYTVWAAANGIEALSLKQQRGIGYIDLLFTDVVMPHMSGKELADRVQVLYPHTRILFTSAYTENAIVHQGVLNKGVALLQKPFTPSALAHKLRAVLDRPESPTAEAAQQTFGLSKIADGENTP
jgi:PAS domain S-box-containing protein